MRNVLSFCDLLRLSLYVSKIDQRLSEKERKINDKKISFLKQKRYGKSLTNGEKHIINLSKYELTEDEKCVLGHGLKYCVPPRSIDSAEILSEFEILFNQLNDKFVPNEPESILSLKFKLAAYAYTYSETNLKNISCNFHKERFRALKSKLATYAHTYSEADLKNLSCNFHKEHFRALKCLRTNGSIIITKPDKGNAVCILDKEDYCTKMDVIL